MRVVLVESQNESNHMAFDCFYGWYFGSLYLEASVAAWLP
jgi:hypothetical protein